MNKIKVFRIYFLVLISFFAFILSSSSRVEIVSAKEGDALAVRVLPNDEHYSPLTWYYKQGFKGNPTPIKVDGYDAIRDGRTVYVNVANIDDKGTPSRNDDSVYTNIYLISYNQEATSEIVSVFDQVLARWKFNSNLTTPGDCFNQSKNKKCLADADCDAGGFCNSLKAKLVRDTKRLGSIIDLRLKIEDYKNNNTFYPKISSGTYLPGKTVSTWPSWNSEFSSVLGGNLPVDPINKLGSCGSEAYDQKTCWDDKNKTFADPNLDNNIFELPDGSEAFIYSISDNAQSYLACAYMESGFMVGNSLGACYGGNTFNNPPEINCGDMIGLAGKEFSGYIKGGDFEGDSFSLSVINQSYLKDAGFSFLSEGRSDEILITANNPLAGDYNVEVSAFGDSFSQFSENCEIKISTQAFIIYPVSDKRQVVNSPVDISIYANNSKSDYSGVKFIITASDNQQLSCQPRFLDDGRVRCDFQVTSTITKNIKVTVLASTNSATASPQEFNVEFYNNPPILSSAVCVKEIRSGQKYSCDFNFSDPDGDGLGNCFADGIPAGFSFSRVAGKPVCRLSGSSMAVGPYSMSLRSADQHGANSENVNLALNVVSYCGDGEKQSPNLEGVGGPSTANNSNGDGYENCDCGVLVNGKTLCYKYDNNTKGFLPINSLYGVPTVGQSNLNWQYDCNSLCSSANGGYCGDGAVQNQYGEECDLGGDTDCCKSCKWTTEPTEWVNVSAISGDNFLKKGESMSFKIPSCRGVVDGAFDATPRPYGSNTTAEAGTAIVFITDISGSQFDRILGKNTPVDDIYYRSARINMLSSVKKFYDKSNAENSSIHVGAIATYRGIVGDKVDIGNLLDIYGGATKKAELDASINTYETIGQPHIDPPAFNSSFATARKMFSSYPNAKDKYIIILTDGYDGNNIDFSEAQAAKDEGVKIYVMAFSNWRDDWDTRNEAYPSNTLKRLCRTSSDWTGSYKSSDCFQSGYSRRKQTASTDPAVVQAELDIIYKDIIDKITSYIPKNIVYSVNKSANTSLSYYSNVSFLPVSSCDISGKNPCNPSIFTFSTDFVGDGEMEYSDFRLKIIPLCK